MFKRSKPQRYLSEERASKLARKVLRKGKPQAESEMMESSGRLSDSLGAWNMSDEEEARIFSSLKENWKKTTLSIRDRVRILDQ